MSLITPKAILSYPRLFVAEKQDPDDPNEKAKFSCALVFPKNTDLKELKQAALEAAREKWGAKADAMIRGEKLRMPFRTDSTDKGYPEGSIFTNVRTTKRPGIVSIYPDPNTGKPLPIVDEEEMYPGVVVRASLAVYAYDVKGNRGVSFALNNLQKVADGERLDGRMAPEDEFEADMDATADLSDMEEDVTEDAPVESGDPLDELMS
jgi:hypothetical protein